MNLVLDVSAAVAIVTNSPLQRMRAGLAHASSVYAPSLYDYELTNVVWKYIRAKLWSPSDAAAVLGDAMELVDERVSASALTSDALSLAIEHQHSTYDMFYILLARNQDAHLLTCDRSMQVLAAKLSVDVIAEQLSS